MVGRANPPLVVKEEVLKAVSVEALAELPVEVVLIKLVDWMAVTRPIVPVRLTWPSARVETLLVTLELAENAWLVIVDTAAALSVFMALVMGCPLGEARAAVTKKTTELVKVNFIVNILREG